MISFDAATSLKKKFNSNCFVVDLLDVVLT